MKDEYKKLQKQYNELYKKFNSMHVNGHNYSHLQRVIQVCETTSRGVFKRIDENRELLEFLQKEASELLERCPWIECWIGSHDCFFNDLVHALSLENPFAYQQRMYPRPWSGK